MKTIIILLLIFTTFQTTIAQTYTKGKHLVWPLDQANESRLKLKFGTTGINIGGYEGTTLVLENITDAKLSIVVKMIITDFCNDSKARTIQVVLNPRQKIGGSTWMGGSEQYDYGTTCKQKKVYDTSFSTKIAAVAVESIDVKNLSNGLQTTGGIPAKTGSSTVSNGAVNTGTSTGSSSSSSGTNNMCPTYGFKFVNTPSYNCIGLEWFSITTQINKIDKSGQLLQLKYPEPKYFKIQYRKKDAINWITEKTAAGFRNNYNLYNLDPCTNYEVRMITSCDNNKGSNPTNTLQFTTKCTRPGNLIIENVTNTSASVENMRVSELNYPCPEAKNRTQIIEYKSQSSLWDSTICIPANPCILNALSPGTTYRVRARFKYDNKIYSEYTNEVSFRTTD